MASSTMELPTADQLHDALARLEGLKQTMRARQAGGKDKRQGRYKKVDMARLHYISNACVIPGLRLGKLVPQPDWEQLFGLADDDFSGPAKQEAIKWADSVYKDPRAGSQLPEMDALRDLVVLFKLTNWLDL